MSLAAVREVLDAVDADDFSPAGLAQVVNQALRADYPMPPADLPLIPLNSVAQETDIPLSALTSVNRDLVVDGIEARDRADADATVARLRATRAKPQPKPSPTPSASATPTTATPVPPTTP